MTTHVTVEEGADRCPDLGLLEVTPLPATVLEHVDACASCKLVVAVIAERATAIGSSDDGDRTECERYDALLAARSDGTLNVAGRNLLSRHLAGCVLCREIAGTLSPNDSDGDHETLPEVERENYEPGKEIARGGMGKILAARDLRIGRPVAVKELLENSPQLAARFEREARLTARLQHPGIVPIYEIGKWADGTPFYTMRMVEGRQLRDAIERAATLPERLALVPSLIAACEAVAFAHSKSVIHRDLTPSNILVGDYGETVVIDWGLALDLSVIDQLEGEHDPGSDRLTHVGAIVGTIPYMPPEQAHAQAVDERADVYSLGAILYHLLAGVPPFRGGSRDELLRQVKSQPPPPIESVTPPGSPRDLFSIVTKAMAFLPENRYPSARELADELGRFQTGRMVEAHHYSRRELVKRFISRNRAALTVTVLATIVLAVLGVISVRRILASSADARAQAKQAKETSRALLFEKGRVELLDGEPLRALAYLHQAKLEGATGPQLDLLLAHAMIDELSSAEQRTLECGSDDRHVDVSPDGALLVAACHDRARVWRIRDAAGNTVAPTEIATLGSGTTPGFDNLRFSNDGKKIATWGDDGVLRLWSVDALTKPPIELVHGTSTITMASFSGDDRILSTTGDDGYARIWDVETGVQGFAIAPTNPIPKLNTVIGRLATRTRDGISKTELLVLGLGTGKRYDVDTRSELQSFALGEVFNGDLSTDGTLAVTCGTGTSVKVIDVVTGKPRAELVGHTDAVWKCVFSADGTRVLTSSHDRTAKVWDITSSARLVTTVKHGDLVWLSRFSHDGLRFFTVSPGKSIKVWDTGSGDLLATYDSRGKDGRFLPDGRFAALRGDGRIQLWGRESLRLRRFNPTSESIIATTPDGAIVTDGFDGVTVRDRNDRRIANTPALRQPVAATPHGQIATVYATTNETQTSWGVAVIDPVSHSVNKVPIETSTTPDFPITVQPAGTRVAVTWSTRSAEIWDVAAGVRVLGFPDANRVVLDEHGKRAIVWRESVSGAVSLPVVWDLDTRARLIEIDAIDARPIGFARDGTRVLVTELARTSSRVASVFGVDDGIRYVTQSKVEIEPTLDPTGRWMTTIDTDGIVTVWSVENGRRLSRFTGPPLQFAQANGDASLLVAIGEYGRAVLVLLPADGHILVRHAVEHERVTVMIDSIHTPPAYAAWTSDSTAFASTAKSFTQWRAKYSLAENAIADVVRKRVPWRIDGGALVRDGWITGQVIRDGVPVAGVAIEVLVRRPAVLGDKRVDWESMKARVERRSAITDHDGRFGVDLLELGLEYQVAASDGTLRVDVQTLASRDSDEPIELRLR